MATVSKPRSFLASVVGWLVVGIIVWFLFGWLVGTILWILRTILIVVVILGLITIYFKLRGPRE
jgi:hypothetical protein